MVNSLLLIIVNLDITIFCYFTVATTFQQIYIIVIKYSIVFRQHILLMLEQMQFYSL